MSRHESQADHQGLSARATGIIILVMLSMMFALVCSIIVMKDAREEAAYATAKGFMKAYFPGMISYQHSQTFNCSELVMNKKDFVRFGLDEETAWGKSWTMRSENSRITLNYSLRGAANPDAAAQRLILDLEPTDLQKRMQVALLSVSKVGSGIVVVYSCPNRSATAP